MTFLSFGKVGLWRFCDIILKRVCVSYAFKAWLRVVKYYVKSSLHLFIWLDSLEKLEANGMSLNI